MDGLRIGHDKAVQIVRLLTEGGGVRAIGRLVDCDPHTVLNVLNTIGEKCHAFHDRSARHIRVESLQLDEIWSRVGCSQKTARRQNNESGRGDFFTFLGIAAKEKFIVSYHTGKRDGDNCDAFIEDVEKRIDGQVQITTDLFRPYIGTVRTHFANRTDFATMQKLYAMPVLPKGEATRRYSPAQCIGIRIKTRIGNPDRDKISTTFIERANLSLRHFNKRFARLGLGYSRVLVNHHYAIAIFVAAYNFCKVHSTIGCTPAVALRLANEAWTIEELINRATTE